MLTLYRNRLLERRMLVNHMRFSVGERHLDRPNFKSIIFKSKLTYRQCMSYIRGKFIAINFKPYDQLLPRYYSAYNGRIINEYESMANNELDKSSKAPVLKTNHINPRLQDPCAGVVGFLRKNLSTTKNSAVQPAYVGPLAKQIRVVKFFSISTSAIGIALQPFLLKSYLSFSPLAGLLIGSFFTCFIFVTPILLHWITKRYVVELSLDPSTRVFTATVLTLLNRKKHILFTAEDVHVPDLPGVFTSFVVNGVPLFVDSQSFEDPQIFKHLMGYDKPLDFHLADDSVSDTKQKEKNNSRKSD
ncbi:transmembrane protein 70 homolog, mitochondrial-like [Limulus polyphemus]|uniref:Transmembrane protein 70 homolog, mitochondrial-like n=1 Tax=Limulus polyphemus TaxID=6850 RepID=A0ABM1BHG2_LIMPO|nr:transmembrane protein 70 homolog, mitochondrial-like [Limulus polyphemus]